MFRGLVLCLCLNLSYANVVRFPRELDQYGSAYLVPYVVLLFLVGLPMVLLEISVGQFLGQGAAHTWRASPIFKGEYCCILLGILQVDGLVLVLVSPPNKMEGCESCNSFAILHPLAAGGSLRGKALALHFHRISASCDSQIGIQDGAA